MSPGDDLPAASAAELLDEAPCGFLTTALDGTILQVNRTFAEWCGLDRDELLGKRRFQDLLASGGRIYYETHFAPLLLMQGEVREIALEVVRADGSELPALVNSVLTDGRPGRPRVIRTMVFDASDRRRYEQELLRSQKREREIARRLQQSLLAGELPAAPGLELAASYRPAIGETEVGGDWYDAFRLDERRIGLVVGDVVGRGIEAAATMGQLRSASRALASTGLRPGPLLEALDGYVRQHGVGRMATVAVAEIDLETGELRFACAGHPPPVAAIGESAPSLLWDGRSAPLDAYSSGGPPRPEAGHELGPQGLVLLYTDGLVERRTDRIDEGLERLLANVGAHLHEPISSLTAGLLRTLDERDGHDDVCVLAATISPPTRR